MAQIDLEILAKFDKAATEVKKFSADSQKQLEKLSKSVNLIGFIELGRVALAAGEKILHALEEPIHVAAAFDEAVNKLNVSLKLSGDYSDEASKSFLELATTFQETTIFGDKAAISAIALAKNLGLTNEQTTKVVKAAADLSASLGVDLETSVQALTKSYQGQNIQLGRLLPITKNYTEQQLLSGAAVDFVASKFNGAAKALGETFSGSLTITGNAFEDIIRVIGQFITQNPIIINAVKAIGEVFKSITHFLEQNKTAIREVADTLLVGFIDAIGNAIKAFGFLTRAIGTLLSLSIGGFVNLNNILNDMLSPILAITDVIVNYFVKSILLAVSSVLELVKLFSQIGVVSEAIKAAGGNVEDFTNSINKANNKLFELTSNTDVSKFRKTMLAASTTFAENFPKGVKIASDAIDSLGNKVTDFGNGSKKDIGKIAKSASDNLSNAFDKPKAAAKELVDITGQLLNFNFAKIFSKKADKEAAVAAIKLIPEQALIDSSNAFKNVVENSGIRAGNALIKAANQFQQMTGINLSNAKEVAALGVGFLGSVSKGATGAKEVLQQIGFLVGEALGGFGEVVSQLVGILSQSPEQFRAMIQQFFESLPQLIENIIINIAELPRLIGERVPELINRLVQELPAIAVKMATTLGNQMPFVATRMAVEFVRNVPEMVRGLVTGIVDALKQAIGSIGNIFGFGGGGGGGGGGGVLGGIVSGIGDIFGFAEGGVVPYGFPNDSFPAALSSGEAVIDRSVSGRLLSFLDSFEKGGKSSSGGGSQTIILQVGEKQLAEVILNLNRNGYRLA